MMPLRLGARDVGLARAKSRKKSAIGSSLQQGIATQISTSGAGPSSCPSFRATDAEAGDRIILGCPSNSGRSLSASSRSRAPLTFGAAVPTRMRSGIVPASWPGSQIRLLRRLQARSCGQTGGRLWKNGAYCVGHFAVACCPSIRYVSSTITTDTDEGLYRHPQTPLKC
jgi:hypothetical protein